MRLPIISVPSSATRRAALSIGLSPIASPFLPRLPSVTERKAPSLSPSTSLNYKSSAIAWCSTIFSTSTALFATTPRAWPAFSSKNSCPAHSIREHRRSIHETAAAQKTPRTLVYPQTDDQARAVSSFVRFRVVLGIRRFRTRQLVFFGSARISWKFRRAHRCRLLFLRVRRPPEAKALPGLASHQHCARQGWQRRPPRSVTRAQHRWRSARRRRCLGRLLARRTSRARSPSSFQFQRRGSPRQRLHFCGPFGFELARRQFSAVQSSRRKFCARRPDGGRSFWRRPGRSRPLRRNVNERRPAQRQSRWRQLG